MANERTMQASRAGQPVTDEMLANYTAARAFLFGEWFGATLCVASFTLLYLFEFGTTVSPKVTYAVCLGLLALGAFAFVRNWRYYERLEFPWARRWHLGALVTASSAAVFWLLFALLVVLAWFGIDVGPPPK